eukprot:CAMPEP_0177650738 /NCGR_PEP_ID=MMETSP0447-20121125/12117_1 /TAXON_ID=0 /ORGANISM="Stygamoeba regulata, Strain BSH-02190019" /LENGTH=265 /DNA_ID=CAMNT_0019153657 /DNA_START=151 /DNA_END=948 /DNA_ORIENTATION=+
MYYLALALLVGVLTGHTAHAKFDNNTISTTCHTSSWWVLVPFNKTTVQSWIPKNVELAAHPFQIDPSTHPVYLEFNRQEHCTQKSLPIFKSTFTEMKLEIPFLKQGGLAGPLMFKPIIYEDNRLDILGSRLVYGLHTVHASAMSKDDVAGTYSVAYQNTGLHAAFTPAGEWEDAATAAAFEPFRSINDRHEWLGHDLLRREKCAMDFYVWPGSRVRPVTGRLHLQAGVFEGLPETDLDIPGGGALPAMQVELTLRISPLDDCTRT